MSAAAKTISDRMPQSRRRLLKNPTVRNETRSVRVASAVPSWPATIPAKVIVVGLEVGAVQRGAARNRIAGLQPARHST